MKIALITDTHVGVRNDHQAFLDNNKRFFEQTFFPELDRRKIEHVVHLGDVLDRRKYVNFVTARRLRKDFIEPLQERGIRLDVILGNHDTYFKNTNEVNSIRELYQDGTDTFTWHEKATEVKIGNLDILLIPWICEDNVDHTLEMIKYTKAQVCFGHLEIAGFEMYRGTIAEDGIDPSVFQKFDQVFSGHFHHQSENGNIKFLGAHGEFTWSDYDDARGFHIYDTITRELEFIPNNFKMFEKVFYDDTIETPTGLNGKFVKIVVKNKNDPIKFDMYIDAIEKQQPINIQIVDDHMNLNLESDEDVIDEAEDTLTIFKKTIAASNTVGIDSNNLEEFVVGLYNEALSIE